MKPPPADLWNRIKRVSVRKSGQAITEHIIITAIVTIGGIATVWLFGVLLVGVSARLTAAMDEDETFSDTKVDKVLLAMEAEEFERRDMKSFTDDVADQDLDEMASP
jgi:hypothetical protein